jgi:hypothetical protein
VNTGKISGGNLNLRDFFSFFPVCLIIISGAYLFEKSKCETLSAKSSSHPFVGFYPILAYTGSKKFDHAAVQLLGARLKPMIRSHTRPKVILQQERLDQGERSA